MGLDVIKKPYTVNSEYTFFFKEYTGDETDFSGSKRQRRGDWNRKIAEAAACPDLYLRKVHPAVDDFLNEGTSKSS